MRTAGPVCLGMVPLGIAFGLLVLHSGLAWWWAPVFSAVVYAGSLEFLLVAMVTAAAPLAQVALTTLVVNSRHVFYALSFPLHRVRGRLGRTYSTFALTDEAYAMTATPEGRRWPGARILVLQVLLHLSWVSGAALGALLGEALPLDSLRGLDFALSALFIVLAIDAYRARPDLRTAVLALGCALAAVLLLPGQMLLAAYAAFTLLLLLRCAVGRRGARRESGRAPELEAVGA
ncbi:AzlC family ABC transporter permease [Geodermatophilus sp. SYSU D00705]